MTDMEHFDEHGFVLYQRAFEQEALSALTAIVMDFHQQWIVDNHDFYQTRAINSAGLTAPRYLNDKQRLALFQFIASEQVLSLLQPAFQADCAFLNTQLFFDPVQSDQKNYWHRDVQYTGLSIDEQQRVIQEDQVVHLRIPLKAENGLALIPGSHKRWDTATELAVRLEEEGRHSFEDLPHARCLQAAVGDALLFSAHAIHRGLYGQERLVLDLVFCDVKAHLLAHRDANCLPSEAMSKQLGNLALFKSLDA